jgi:hypothetical protein
MATPQKLAAVGIVKSVAAPGTMRGCPTQPYFGHAWKRTESRNAVAIQIDCGLLLPLDSGEINGENVARLRRAHGEKIHPRTCRLA